MTSYELTDNFKKSVKDKISQLASVPVVKITRKNLYKRNYHVAGGMSMSVSIGTGESYNVRSTLFVKFDSDGINQESNFRRLHYRIHGYTPLHREDYQFIEINDNMSELEVVMECLRDFVILLQSEKAILV